MPAGGSYFNLLLISPSPSGLSGDLLSQHCCDKSSGHVFDLFLCPVGCKEPGVISPLVFSDYFHHPLT